MSHRILLAGAAGAVGKRLTPLLRDAGHYVAGTTRTEARAAKLRAQGVDAFVVDVFDAEALSRAFASARPDVVIHQLTRSPPGLDPGRMGEAIVHQRPYSRRRNPQSRKRCARRRRPPPRDAEHCLGLRARPTPAYGERSARRRGGGTPRRHHTRRHRARSGVAVAAPRRRRSALRTLYGPGTGVEDARGAAGSRGRGGLRSRMMAVDHAVRPAPSTSPGRTATSRPKGRAQIPAGADFRLPARRVLRHRRLETQSGRRRITGRA